MSDQQKAALGAWAREGRNRVQRKAQVIAFPLQGDDVLVTITRGTANVLRLLLEGREALIDDEIHKWSEGLAETRRRFVEDKLHDPEVSADQIAEALEVMDRQPDLRKVLDQLTEDRGERALLVHVGAMAFLDELLTRVFVDHLGEDAARTAEESLRQIARIMLDLTDNKMVWVAEFMTWSARVKVTAAWWREASLTDGHMDRFFQQARTHRRTTAKVGRNQPCSCGSETKYKKCCGRVG